MDADSLTPEDLAFGLDVDKQYLLHPITPNAFRPQPLEFLYYTIQDDGVWANFKDIPGPFGHRALFVWDRQLGFDNRYMYHYNLKLRKEL
jgi:hypothetical protein